MRLTESVTIQAPAETVWFFLDDPDLVKAWNPKVIAWEPLGNTPRGPGFTFRIQYGMRGRQSWWEGRFSEYRPHTRLVWDLHDPAKPDHRTQLSYELEPRGNAVRLTQHIDFPDAMIPLPFRWLVKLIFKTGKPRGERYLATLKRLAEEQEQSGKRG